MKQLFWWLAFRLGVVRLFRWRNADKVAVLMYHGIVPDDAAVADGDWLQVRASDFRRQMRYLSRHYDTGGLDRSPGPAARPRAVVTFDDGYANNHAVAFPVLRELNIPAIVFLVTGTVDTDRLYWWDRLFLAANRRIAGNDPVFDSLKRIHPSQIDAEVAGILESHGITDLEVPPPLYRSLNSDEIMELADSGLVEFGSHTHGHEILAQLTDAEAEATIRASREWLAARGIEPRFFAAPNGTYLDHHIPLLRALGFAAALGTDERLWTARDNRYRIPRFAIGRDCSLAEFACLISGFAGWVKGRKLRLVLLGAGALTAAGASLAAMLAIGLLR